MCTQCFEPQQPHFLCVKMRLRNVEPMKISFIFFKIR